MKRFLILLATISIVILIALKISNEWAISGLVRDMLAYGKDPYFNPTYFLEEEKKFLKSVHKTDKTVNPVYDYDFPKLKQLEKKLQYIDRPAFLKALYQALTVSAKNNQEVYASILFFLQKTAYHSSLYQPIYPNKAIVTDPVLLLTLKSMRCGHIAAVAADLFHAGGYKTRMVNLNSHVIAEVFFDHHWHYIDANVFEAGQYAKDKQDIPSVKRICDNPALIDKLNDFPLKQKIYSVPYISQYYCGKASYPVPAYLYKKKDKNIKDRYFGWKNTKTVVGKVKYLSSPKYQPSMPFLISARIKHVDKTNYTLHIDWKDVADKDNDLIGYRVFIGTQSRQWDYQEFWGNDEPKQFWFKRNNVVYKLVNEQPSSNIGAFFTKKSEMSIPLQIPPNGTVYISIMPFDQYGKSINRKIFALSNELKFSAGVE